MKNKVNDKVVENMIDYVKENIPSIENRDNIDISYSNLGDTIIEFKSDKIAVSYGHIMDHMLENPFNNLMNFRTQEESKYVYDYMKNQYQSYKDKGIRLIQLFDVTLMNFEYGGAEYDLSICERMQFKDLPLTEMFGEKDARYLDLDLRYCDYDHFRFKDRFEIANTSSDWIWVCGTSYLDEANNFLKEKCNCVLDDICPDCFHEMVKNNHVGIFFDAGHQLLKMKD